MVENDSNTLPITPIFYEIISIFLYFLGLFVYSRRLFILSDNLKFKQNFLVQSDLILQIVFHVTKNQLSFKEWVLSLDSSKISNINKFSNEERSKIINNLIQYAIIEPTVPLNCSCKPEIQMSLKCEDYFLSFNGQRDPQAPKPKIAHLIQYGFETDVLEILLSEVYDYIDKFFIIESEVTHYQSIKKTLVWPLLSKQKRFQRYLDKVVYFNITYEMSDEYSKTMPIEQRNSIWRNELIQEQLRFKLFLQWNTNNGNYFTGDDIIGFGDTDEIPSFHNLILLKKCVMRGTTDVGIWFTFGQVNKYFNSDHPVLHHKDTLGDPTYWYLKDAIKKGNPSRNRGKSPFFVLGGIHLTHYGYLPNLILKDLSQTENDNGGVLLAVVQRLLKKKMTVKEVSKIVFENIDVDFSKYSVLDSNRLNSPPFMVPWIMQCNPKRYPSFFNLDIPDNRIM